MANTASFLKTVIHHREIEAEWLDLLAQLEFVGCRKIARSVRYAEVTSHSLQHLMEEASHAFLLKRLADRRLARPLSWKNGLFSQAGFAYFQALDKAIAAMDKPGVSDYQAVSWGIERRVLELYPLYAELSEDPEVRRVLRVIVAQERRHGTEFDEAPLAQSTRDAIVAKENELWEKLLIELHQCLPTAADFEATA